MYRKSDLTGKRNLSPEQRFWARVEKTDGCWLWTGGLNKSGYAGLKVDGKTVLAHRWIYEAQVGAIPEGMTIDHMCGVKHCVNPAHLRPLSLGDNGRAHWREQRGLCKNNLHPTSDENTVWTPSGRRYCRPCRKAGMDRAYAKKKASQGTSS